MNNIQSSNFLSRINDKMINDDAQIRLKSPAPEASSTAKTKTPNASIGSFSIRSFFFPEKNDFYGAKIAIKQEFLAACPLEKKEAMAQAFDKKFLSFSERLFGDFFGTTALTMGDVRDFQKEQESLYDTHSISSGDRGTNELTPMNAIKEENEKDSVSSFSSDDDTVSMTPSEVSQDNNEYVYVTTPDIDSEYEFVTAEEEKYQPPLQSLSKGLNNITSAIFSFGGLFASKATYRSNTTDEKVQVPKKGAWKIDLNDSNNQQIINGNLKSLVDKPDPDAFFRDAGRTFNYTIARSSELTTVGIEEVPGGGR